MTFRTALQIQIKALQDIYDNAEGLRDIAGVDEMNFLRSYLPQLWEPLRDLDNRMTNQLAAFELKGNYSVIVKEDSI